MHVNFTYNPEMEVTTLRAGLTSAYNSSSTTFALEAQAAGIDFMSPEQVSAFCRDKIANENIQINKYIEEFQAAWNPVEDRATSVFQRMFETNWDPNEVTAYLSLGTRCPYNTAKRYYFVSVAGNVLNPVSTSLHELSHFYAHATLETQFKEANKSEYFGNYKEALTILLNEEFANVMEKRDVGYPQHSQLREWILSKYTGKGLRIVTKEYFKLL
jgi:hypothetical protein